MAPTTSTPLLAVHAAADPALLSTHATALGEGAAEATEAWAMLLPAGRFAGRDGRGPYDAGDAVAMRAIVDRSLARAGLTELVVDYDHQTQFAAVAGVGGQAPAAGWIRALEARADGVWARVAWTEAAKARIRAGEYRYLSPVYHHDRDGRVLRLISAGLTNTPNLDLAGAVAARAAPTAGAEETMEEILKALGLPAGTSTADALAAIQAALAGATALQSVAQAVGLAAGAAPAAVLTAVQAARNPDPARFVPIDQVTALQTQLTTLQTSLHADRVETAVAAAIKDGKVAPALKEWATDLATKDFAAFTAFCAAAPVLTAAQGAGRDLPAGGDAALDDTDRAVMSAMGLSEEAFKATRKKEAR